MQKNVQYKRICKEDTYMFNYTQLPDDLFKIDHFSKLSLHAKVLYSFMLRRVSISKEKNWIDEAGDVYIYYRADEVMEKFNCSNKTAAKIMAELEDIGLIEKRRQGQGNPTIIYVNKFSEAAEISNDEDEPELPIEHMELLSSTAMINEEAENSGENAEKSEVKKVHVKKCKNYTSKNVKSTLPEVKNLHANYKEKNYKDIINSSSISPLISREHVRLMEEEEESYKKRIRYGEAERLYSAQIASAVYAELIKRSADYQEKFNAEMFSRICKSISQSREPIVSMPGLVNWCLDRVRVSFTPSLPQKNNLFCQFPQREYDYKELERELLGK